MNALSAALEALFGADLERLTSVTLLVLARTVPLAFLAPWLGWKGMVAIARIAIAVALSAAFLPLALVHAPSLPTSWLALLILGAREALLGASFAIAASVPLYALGWTGQLIDRWRGSPVDATSIGPAGRSSPLGALYLGAGVVLFVILGGHRLAIAAFADTLIALPLGEGASASSLADFALGAGQIVTHTLTMTLAFLLPAALSFVVLELVLGLWARVAPGLRLWVEAMPLRAGLGIAVALLTLVALLPRLGPVYERSIDTASGLLERLSS